MKKGEPPQHLELIKFTQNQNEMRKGFPRNGIFSTKLSVSPARYSTNGLRNRFEAIFNCIDITPLLKIVFSKYRYGPGVPNRNDHVAMLYSLFVRIIERIPTVKDLVRRLKNDAFFRWCCGFELGERVPSESSYSRMLKKLSDHPHLLQDVQQQLIERAIQEGFK
jgi:transposase